MVPIRCKEVELDCFANAMHVIICQTYRHIGWSVLVCVLGMDLVICHSTSYSSYANVDPWI